MRMPLFHFSSYKPSPKKRHAPKCPRSNRSSRESTRERCDSSNPQYQSSNASHALTVQIGSFNSSYLTIVPHMAQFVKSSQAPSIYQTIYPPKKFHALIDAPSGELLSLTFLHALKRQRSIKPDQ
mgnify:CR=1 FL=1